MAHYVNLNIGEDYNSITFNVGNNRIMEIGSRMEEICEDAYMNGYNWEAFLNSYLEQNDPEIFDAIETDSEADMYCALMFERWRDEDDKVWYRVNLLYRSTDQIRNADVLSPDNPLLRYDLSFTGVETNEDGLISEDDLYKLFEKAIKTYYDLEDEYTLDAAA